MKIIDNLHNQWLYDRILRIGSVSEAYYCFTFRDIDGKLMQSWEITDDEERRFYFDLLNDLIKDRK